MSKSLSNVFIILKKDAAIIEDEHFLKTISSIEKFYDNEKEIAYLLGYFFKYKFDSDNLSVENKSFLISEIKQHKLDAYFYLKQSPENLKSSSLLFITFIFILLGCCLTIIGGYNLLNSKFDFLVNAKYEVVVFREGGYYLIFGLISLVGGILQYKFQLQKKCFISSLQK